MFVSAIIISGHAGRSGYHSSRRDNYNEKGLEYTYTSEFKRHTYAYDFLNDDDETDYQYRTDWRKKCLEEMPADECPEDHEELQPQDADNGNKLDNAAEYEEIYNELIKEKKEKKAKRRAELEELKRR